MLSKPQHKHNIDFSQIRKHPFMCLWQSWKQGVGLKTTLSLGVTHLNNLIYRKLKSIAQAVFLTAHLLPNVYWETMPGHSERQWKAFRSEVSWVFTTVSLSSEVLEGFRSLHWQLAGGPQEFWRPLMQTVLVFPEMHCLRGQRRCARATVDRAGWPMPVSKGRITQEQKGTKARKKASGPWGIVGEREVHVELSSLFITALHP